MHKRKESEAQIVAGSVSDKHEHRTIKVDARSRAAFIRPFNAQAGQGVTAPSIGF